MAGHSRHRSSITLDAKAVEAMLSRVGPQVAPDDFELIKGLVDTIRVTLELLVKRGTTIAQIQRLFGVSRSKKPAGVAGPEPPPSPPDAATQNGAGAEAQASGTPLVADGKGAALESGETAAESKATDAPEEEPKKRKKVKGHGRIPASAYLAANHIAVPHTSMHVGDPCPEGCAGKLGPFSRAATIVRIFGQAPLTATCWDCEQLRCNTCGKVYTARAPAEAQGPKYDETAASMMAMMTYGTGMPFYRMAGLQRNLNVPVPASTQWQVVEEREALVRPAHEELVRHAAQGSLFHNDDSHKPILDLMGKRRARLLEKGQLPDPDRTGLFTTAIVSIAAARPPIVLFFTGRAHAGENLASVLTKREAGLPPPIQMGDALTRNVPKGHAVLEANCLTHAFRKFVEEKETFPADSHELLEGIGHIYKVDERCRENKLSPEERLKEHQRESGPVMEALRRSMEDKLAKKLVEPNSSLGQAFNYLLKRWDKFTLFLRVPGAPLDNNICERALKMAIKHRNGSLFYRSLRGARVGDVYMSLIYTAERCGENPFDYLTALQRHHKAVAESPADWVPWKYRETLARVTGSAPAATPRAPPSAEITQPAAA